MNEKIYENTRAYRRARILTDFATRCHYNSVTICGKENIPAGSPYIIAPCHQNALMDPMVILLLNKRPVVFLCRGDLFANATARRWLTFLKILPVYRMRDGRDQLSKNDDTFEASIETLRAGVPVCIMAEGTHNDRHQLLPLSKGTFRIAAKTQQLLGDKDLYILPVGIDYDDYEAPYSNVVVNVGAPMAVREYTERYGEEGMEAVMLNEMKKELSRRLRGLMHQIDSKEHYTQVRDLCEIDNAQYRQENHLDNNAKGRFVARQQLAQRLNEMEATDGDAFATELQRAEEIATRCQTKGVNLRAASDPWPKGLIWINLIVIAAIIALWLPFVGDIVQWCLLSCPMALLPTHLVARRLVKDTQFRSSINYGIRFGLAVIYTPIAFIVVLIFGGVLKGVLLLILAWLMLRYGGRAHYHLRELWRQIEVKIK